LHNVKPGIIIEERFTAIHCHGCPPLEFKAFVIWGRVWVVLLDYVKGGKLLSAGFLHRNGTMVAGQLNQDSPLENWLDWVDFKRVVEIAEHLGAHKDLMRVDIFVGVPARSPPANSWEERLNAVEYVVSEVAFHPTTRFLDDEVMDEGARLWIAGYKMGNYRVVPNAEVPTEFVETGSLSSKPFPGA
jgi:hypothetical protein